MEANEVAAASNILYQMEGSPSCLGGGGACGCGCEPYFDSAPFEVVVLVAALMSERLVGQQTVIDHNEESPHLRVFF